VVRFSSAVHISTNNLSHAVGGYTNLSSSSSSYRIAFLQPPGALTDKIRLFVRVSDCFADFAEPNCGCLLLHPHPRRVDLIGQSDPYNTIPRNGPYSVGWRSYTAWTNRVIPYHNASQSRVLLYRHCARWRSSLVFSYNVEVRVRPVSFTDNTRILTVPIVVFYSL
jgi:hypothetical protein